MAEPTNTFTGAKAVPFNSNTQQFGSSTPTNPVNYSMGQINVDGSKVLGSSPTVVSNETINKTVLPETDKQFDTLSEHYKATQAAQDYEKQRFANMTPEERQQQQFNQQANQSFNDYNQGPQQYQTDSNAAELPYTIDSLGQKHYQGDTANNTFGGPDFVEGNFNPRTGMFDPGKVSEEQSIMNGFDRLSAQSDSITAQTLQNAKEQYNLAREAQKKANVTQENALRQQYSRYGASGASITNMIAPKIQENLDKLTKLDAQERGVYLQALQAKNEKDAKTYKDKVDLMADIRKAKIEQAQKVNDLAIKHADEEKERVKQIEKENVMNDLYSKGFTTPKDLVSQARKQGVDITFKEADDAVALLSGIGGTGIIGEYNFYKSQALQSGQTPVDFQTYQDLDANRKKLAAEVTSSAGLNPKQTQNFIRITDKFQADPFINNALKGQTAISIADQVIANPQSATNQLKALYVLVKNLDPDSAVREGEISLAEKTASYLQNWNTTLTRVNSGQVIAPSVAVQLAEATKDLAKSWSETASKRQKQYEAQAAGADIKDAFNEYLQASGINGVTNVGDKILKEEGQAQKDFEEIIGNNPPEIQQEISNRLNDLKQVLGREPTAAEYFEANPWDKPKRATNGGGIVSGVDITSYATDPKHEQKITNIVEKLPETGDTFYYDTYIKSIAPQSPVTGQMVLNASSTYGVDPRLVLAIIQNDSSFGTKGKAVTTLNPGNVGNDDEGNIRKYKSWNEGVLAVAKWLANHRIQNTA